LTAEKLSFDSDPKKSTANPTSVGNTYYLPRQTIRVAITYELTSCGSYTDPEKEESWVDKVEINKSATVSTANSIDSNAKFHIPTETLSSGNKTTSLTVTTLDDGTLRSLGATVDDRTSEIVGGAISSAGSIVRLAATGGVFTASANPKPQCSDEFRKFVKSRDNLTQKLLDPYAFQGEGERVGAIEALSRLTALTRHTRNISFTPDPTDNEPHKRVSRRFDTSASSKNRLGKWLNSNGAGLVDRELKTVICIRPGIDDGEKIPAIDAKAKTKNNDNMCGGNTLLKQASPSKTKGTGLVYRDPKNVRVAVCGETCSKIIGQGQVALAQFGPWRYIELTSKAFQDKSVMASWNAAGRLTSLTIGSSSSLEALANSLNTSAASVRETVGEVITTDQEALNAEIALIRSQADLIEQQNRLNTLQSISTDPIE